MDLFSELESTAQAADTTNEVFANHDTDSEVKRWQFVFGLNEAAARSELDAYLNDTTTPTISNEHWSIVREDMEAKGFSKHAYVYSLRRTHPMRISTPIKAPVTQARGTYILRLEDPISTPETLRHVLGLTDTPERHAGESDTDPASICKLSFEARTKLLDWLASNHPRFKPTIVRLSKATKELDPNTPAPYLGIDTTLPHNRSSTVSFQPRPRQDEYPVWYFFYGRLAEPETLQRLLDLDSTPSYEPAKVYGAKMGEWGGKYRAVVDGTPRDCVMGRAFLVTTQTQEEALLFFETGVYEVVRCGIYMGRVVQPGLVFRFVGADGDCVARL